MADAINKGNDLVNRAITRFYLKNLAYKPSVSIEQAVKNIKSDDAYAYPFSPAPNIDALIHTVPRHIEATTEMLMGDYEKFFAGGMLIYFENHGDNIEIVYQNTTSRSSLGLHAVENREHGALSNKTQQYRYKISLAEFIKQLNKKRDYEKLNDK